MELNRMQTKLKFSKCFIKGKAIILCFILVSLTASVTMSPILSAWQGYRVRVPNVPVNMVETYPGASSYFGTTLSGIGAGYDVHNGIYVGWCCDEHHYIYPGTTYSVQLYSTYNPSMQWPDPDWDMVNYLLNHKDLTASKDQIQSAIWYFINGGYSGSDTKILGMINATIAHGEGFVPQEGQICAVLCDAGATVQHTFIEVLVNPPCTVYVDDDYTVSTPDWGYDHFKVIQDGVDTVCYTGTVIVHDGIYNEHVIINKPIILRNGSLPIIDGGGSGDGITIAANGVTIDGFEIRNCANGIISSGTDNSIIKNNIIHDNLNTGYAGCGIMFWSNVNDFDGNQILHNVIYNNDRQGIYIGGSYNDAIISEGNTISNNTIYTNGLNTLGNGPDNSSYGIQLSYADSNIISGNDIYGHIWDYTGSGYWYGQGIYLNNAYQNTVTSNYLHDNNYGVGQYTDGGRIQGTNYVHCNDIYSNTKYGIRNIDAVQMDAECNWWGDCSGPSTVGLGSGDNVSTNVDYAPWVGYIIAEANGPYTGDITGVVHFDSSGSHGPGCCDESVLSYDWDFGDGSPHSSEANPTYSYTMCGTYTATLTVTVTARGETCFDTDPTNVIIPTNLVVNKTVWDGSHWVDEIRAPNGTLLQFKISITNNGLPVNNTIITDILSTPQLEYRDQSNIAPFSSSAHEVIWHITTPIIHGGTIVITYLAMAVHECYGWNSVSITDSTQTEIAYDIVQCKVIKNANQPELDITKQVWDGYKWSTNIKLTANTDLMFKITVSSTALFTVHNVIVTDNMPLLVQYNDHATPAPFSSSPNQVIWKLGDMAPGSVQVITYNVTTIKMGTDYNIASVTSNEGHYDEDYVLLTIDSPPSIQLLYPQGGETLKNIVTIQWYAHDVKDGNNLPIFIYYKDVNATLWTKFQGSNPYTNSGHLTWDTTSIPDGSYQLEVVTQDSNNNLGSDTSTPFQIKNHEQPSQNLAPNTPNTPQGTPNGKINVEYTYTTSTTDPNGDQVYYLWDWGDGTNSGWLGPYNSGTAISTTHTWTVKGSYSIKVKAKDTFGKESSYSDPLPITMPYSYNPILPFLERWFQRFPHAFPILRQLLGY